jgi:hypothetical protein
MVGGMRGQVNKSECVGGLSTGEKIFHFASENQVTFGPVQNTTPVWSPDGNWIAGSTMSLSLHRRRARFLLPGFCSELDTCFPLIHQTRAPIQ